MINKLFLQKIKDHLLLQKKELSNKVINQPDVVDTDGDETDEVQGKMLVQLDTFLNARNSAKLLQIEDALKRIDDNTYGYCQDCEEPILEKRLVFNPHFLTCISCAEERELNNKQRKGF